MKAGKTNWSASKTIHHNNSHSSTAGIAWTAKPPKDRASFKDKIRIRSNNSSGRSSNDLSFLLLIRYTLFPKSSNQ